MIFENYHPAALFLYFLSVLMAAMFITNPVIQCMALLGACLFCVMLHRDRGLLSDVGLYVSLFLLVSVSNPIFSHNGMTPLFFINNNPVTLEAVVYGVFIAVMLVSVLLWCRAYSTVMTTDKFIYLFGRIIPKLSLTLSMTLRFIPMLRRRMRQVSDAQRAAGLYASGSYIDRVRGAMSVFSAIVSWSMENAIETSMSMKSRGYGLEGRTNYAPFRFYPADGVLLGVTVSLLAVTLAGVGTGQTAFNYYPSISSINDSYFALTVYVAFGALCLMPFLIELFGRIKWKYYISKI